MKKLLTTLALLVSTSASAYTCNNDVSHVNGEWLYTKSVCGQQEPASEEVLAMITYIANNPPKDREEEEVVAITIVVPVVEIINEVPVSFNREHVIYVSRTFYAAYYLPNDAPARLKALRLQVGVDIPTEALLEHRQIRRITTATYADGSQSAESVVRNTGTQDVSVYMQSGAYAVSTNYNVDLSSGATSNYRIGLSAPTEALSTYHAPAYVPVSEAPSLNVVSTATVAVQ